MYNVSITVSVTLRKEIIRMKELYERTVFDVVEFENEDIVTDSNETPTMPF